MHSGDEKKELESYLRKVCKEVYYTGAHKEIRQELINHIEDHCLDLVERGYNKSEAMNIAIGSMGDPEEVGKSLNQWHKPYLGFAVILTRLVVWIIGVLMIFSIAADLIDAYSPEEGVDKEHVVKEIVVDEKRMLDERTIELDRIYIMDNNEVIIYYWDYFEDQNPFKGHWTFSGLQVTDNNDNMYSGGSYSGRHYFKGYHKKRVVDFDMEASYIKLFYDGFNRSVEFIVPLEESL